jgi:hypothetical protein
VFDFGKRKAREVDPDSLEDTPVPTYEEWLNENAEYVFNHPACFLAKGAIALIKYLWTREQLMIQLLKQKDILLEHEVEEHFGSKAHEECAAQGVKSLTRTAMRAASQGKMTGPDGENIDPDTVLVVLNDILDLNDTGWNGHTLEVMGDMFGGADEMQDSYKKEVERIKILNAKRAAERDRLAKKQTRFEAELERQKGLEAQRRVQREHRLKIYVSQCKIYEKDPPTDEERAQMLEGEIEIPRVA